MFYGSDHHEVLICRHGAQRVNELAYNMSTDAIDGYLKTPKQRKEAYDFCDLSFGPCSVSVVKYIDHMSIVTGAC